METLELKKDFYWVGVKDRDLKVFDVIMETEFGTTYNSYLLKGSEKTVLFETAKERFYDEYLEAVEGIVDLSQIDYIVLDHTEPDHAGSLGRLIERNPNVKVVGTATAINFLKNIINRDFYSLAVKSGDTLSLGGRTLRFLAVPNLHWPDTMYTYIEEDQVLLTCDSFGAHYAFDGILLSQVTDEAGYERAAKYYFDNILGPFKTYMSSALEKIGGLPIFMICPGHGPVIDCRIEEILEKNRKWSQVVNPNPRKTVIMPYVSAYGYTGDLAAKIAEGIRDSGDVDVRLYDMADSGQDQVLEEIRYADGLLFGTPTIVGEALKPIWELTTSLYPPVHGGKLAGAFGSYGWSGEGVSHIADRLKQLRMKVVDGFRVKFKPGKNDLIDAYEYGFDFGCILQNKENPHTKKSARKALVKCLVCGAVFEEGTEICPVCGVGKDNFVAVEEEATTFKKNTEEIFLILGNGAAGISAAEAIRERNETCSIVIASDEQALGYNRPMLTKSILAAFNPEQLAIHDEAWYQENRIVNVLGKTVKSIDPEAKEALFSDGMKLKFGKCIYALGSSCFVPPIPGRDKPEVIAIRNLEDARKVGTLLRQVRSAVVIGGGVLGLEAAWEISKSSCKVTVLEVAPQLMGRQLDMSASGLLKEIIESKGIDIHVGVNVEEIEGDGHVTGVRLDKGTVIPAQLVIISAGVRANTDVAKTAGIETDRAVVVNERMETSVDGIYACGDCAQFEGINFAVWPEAVEEGKVAGANAAGDDRAYRTVTAALTFNGMETSLYAVGDNGKNPDLKYKTAEFYDRQKQTYEKYYFVNNRLAGVILLGDVSKMAKVMQAVEEHKNFKEMF